jgi:tRNA nucleotidyltransferase (CCA-adding enzyme)
MKVRDLFENTTIKLDPSIVQKILTPDLELLHKIFASANFELRIVGGAVRDLVLGKKPKDIDLATNATPTQMVKLGEEYLDSIKQMSSFGSDKFRTIPNGYQLWDNPSGVAELGSWKHGTVPFIINGEMYEITTLRTDVETDGRHAQVAFVTDFKEDAARRDFSYNAMSLGFDGTLYDYFGGLEDLRNKSTRFVGNADARIKEDFLRILRFFRFNQRFNNPSADQATMQAIKNNAAGLKRISGERVWVEVRKILEGNSPSTAIKSMCELDVASVIGLHCAGYQQLDHLQSIGATAITLLSILVKNKANAEQIVAHWKLSNTERDELIFLVENRSIKFNLTVAEDMVINGINPARIMQLAMLHNTPDIARKIEHWKPPVFPVSGNDLLTKGMKPSKEMGDVLRKLKALWIQSRFKLSKDELLHSIGLQEEMEKRLKSKYPGRRPP